MLVPFLLGNRRAIETVLVGRWSVISGLLLTISAGLARTYDTADLLHQPWRALVGIPIALGNALGLLSIVYAASSRPPDGSRRFWPTYRAFLGAFLWTAPVAWLYAVPYERFLSPVDAVNANLRTLAAVATWRVLLISRVLSVLLGRRFVPVLLLTLLWSDAVVFLATIASDVPVIDVMGALQHSPEDAALSSAAFATGMFSVLSAPVLLVAALIGLRFLRPHGTPVAPVFRVSSKRSLIPAALALVGALALLPLAQGEQVRRTRAERLLRNEQVAAALIEMSAHQRADYPPVWDPPPRMGHHEAVPSLDDVRVALLTTAVAPWVRDLFLPKLRLGLRRHLPFSFARKNTWQEIAEEVSDPKQEFWLSPEDARIAEYLAGSDPTLSVEDRDALLVIARAPQRTAPPPRN